MSSTAETLAPSEASGVDFYDALVPGEEVYGKQEEEIVAVPAGTTIVDALQMLIAGYRAKGRLVPCIYYPNGMDAEKGVAEVRFLSAIEWNSQTEEYDIVFETTYTVTQDNEIVEDEDCEYEVFDLNPNDILEILIYPKSLTLHNVNACLNGGLLGKEKALEKMSEEKETETVSE